jgi:hypothetical protein
VLRRNSFRYQQVLHRFRFATPHPRVRPGEIGVKEHQPRVDPGHLRSAVVAISTARPGSPASASNPSRHRFTLAGPKNSASVVVSPV